MAVAHILLTQPLDVTLHLNQHALHSLVVGLDLVHVWSEGGLEHRSEEFLIQAVQPLLYLDNRAADLHQHCIHHQLDAADPLDQLALHPVEVTSLRVHLLLQVQDLRDRLRHLAFHVSPELLVPGDPALHGLLDVVEVLPKFPLYIHLRDINYYIITT